MTDVAIMNATHSVGVLQSLLWACTCTCLSRYCSMTGSATAACLRSAGLDVATVMGRICSVRVSGAAAFTTMNRICLYKLAACECEPLVLSHTMTRLLGASRLSGYPLDLANLVQFVHAFLACHKRLGSYSAHSPCLMFAISVASLLLGGKLFAMPAPGAQETDNVAMAVAALRRRLSSIVRGSRALDESMPWLDFNQKVPIYVAAPGGTAADEGLDALGCLVSVNCSSAIRARSKEAPFHP